MDRITTRILAASLGFLLVSGCTEPAPKTIANRVAAPSGIEVASKTPTVSNFPEFADGGGRRDEPAPLPPLPMLSPLDRGPQPISFQVGREDAPPLPALGVGRNGAMQPLEQLIYGGAYPERGEGGTYRFNVRDKLRLSVEDHPEFDGVLEVQQDGTIRLPNTTDEVMAQGVDQERLGIAVADKLAPYVRERPTVKISIVLGRGEFYYIFGEIRNNGRFPMGLKPIRLSEAIFRTSSAPIQYSAMESREERIKQETEIGPREGFNLSRYVALNQVHVITPHRSRPYRRTYNVKAALLQGRTGEDPYLKPGQIVFVPSTYDKRLMEFCTRVIMPLTSVNSLREESGSWYERISGNEAKE